MHHMPGLDAREQSLCSMIASRDSAMRRELAEHVAIPTGKSHPPGIERYRALLIDRLSALGGKIDLVPGDARPAWLDASDQATKERDQPLPIVVAKRHVNKHSPRILIAGHMDTVHDPHGSFRELAANADGTTAVGPGVVDMKGGILIALHALESLEEAGIRINWTFILNSDEETGSFQSARVLHEQAKQHDVGIAIEPAVGKGGLAIERMGSGQFMIEVFGQSAHVGRDFEQGVSAVTALARVLLKLSEMAQPNEGRIVNVGPLRGGTVTNAVPDYAACWGNVRYANPEAGEALGRMIDALATKDVSLPRVVVHRLWNRPAKPLTPSVHAFAEAVKAAATDLNQPIFFTSTGGVCDGNILQNAGLPTIDTLGVRGGNLHRPDEFIELASLVDRCQLLAVLLVRLADGRVSLGET